MKENDLELRPEVKCNDGFSMSVQEGKYHYCTKNVSAEIGFPSEIEPLIMDYAEDAENPTQTVYARVPFAIVNAVIKKHGGIKNNKEIRKYEKEREIRELL